MIRKIKFGTHECRHAGTLYLQADNASENQNTTFLSGFLNMPPGHSHNGRDAVHHIHNRAARNCFSFTLTKD
jgi:hypothetical protein